MNWKNGNHSKCRCSVRKEILDNALQTRLGLMTTWDLFRLVRGFRRHSWTSDQAKPLFYQTSRIFPVPRHYEYIGKVKDVWKKAFSVQIESATLGIGDRISIEFPIDFEEQPVTSLRLSDAVVQSATVGNEVGISRDEASSIVKAGLSVYRIANGSVSR